MKANRALRRRAAAQAAVSDVIGSVLLIGITVLTAGAFALVLFQFEGPDDTLHAQLAVVVGPGADGDWGTNDAELRIVHLGGEALDQNRTTIRYTPTGGTAQTVTPTFPGGELEIGEEWTLTISADAGDAIPVAVIVRLGDTTMVLSSATVTGGATAATLVYVTSSAVAVGSISALGGAQSASDSNNATVLTEAGAGGTPTTSTLSPGATSGSGAANPGNVQGADDARAVLDAAGEWAQGSSFSAPGGAVAISAISIGMEARYSALASTVAHKATLTGSANSGNTVSTASLLGSAGDVYLAAVANGQGTPRTVTGISGPPGIAWSAVGVVANSAGTGELEVWVGTGTPSIAGIVTATFSGTVDRAAIAVSRYSGVDPSSPIEATTSGEAGGSGSAAVSAAAIAGTATAGRFYAAVNGVGASGGNPTAFASPGTELADHDPGGGNQVQLGVADGAAAASNTLAATLGSSQDWQAVALTLRPLAAAAPTAVLSYSLPGFNGTTTSLSQPLTGSDQQYTASIVGDRAWGVGDLANLAVRVTYDTDTGSDVEVDHLFVTVTTTTTPTTYSMDIVLDVDGVQLGNSETVQVRYKVTGTDTFSLAVWNATAWRTCPGALSSTTYATLTCALVLPAEHNGGTPRLRFTDNDPAGTVQGTVALDYARVSSSV